MVEGLRGKKEMKTEKHLVGGKKTRRKGRREN